MASPLPIRLSPWLGMASSTIRLNPWVGMAKAIVASSPTNTSTVIDEAVTANSSLSTLRDSVITFGPHANCTLAICPIEWSVYQYRPSLAANTTFIALFSVAMAVHVLLGVRWRSWWFMVCMLLGCLNEIAGYIGRIILYDNPFSFIGFILQVVFITGAPVYYTAAIYVTLSKTIEHFDPKLSRITPRLLYWIFIPADVTCLSLQATGGALSSASSGSSQSGVDIALVGLVLQVVVLFVFSVLFADYLIRYFRKYPNDAASLPLKMRLFLGFLGTAVVLIFARCLYRTYELSQGYVNSSIVTNQGLFIALEGVPIVLAVFALCIGHPGLVFNSNATKQRPRIQVVGNTEEVITEYNPLMK